MAKAVKSKVKLYKFRVSMTLWRETWGGRDQNDGQVTLIVEARGPKSAINKAREEEIGGSWSHSRWTTNEIAERL